MIPFSIAFWCFLYVYQRVSPHYGNPRFQPTPMTGLSFLLQVLHPSLGGGGLPRDVFHFLPGTGRTELSSDGAGRSKGWWFQHDLNMLNQGLIPEAVNGNHIVGGKYEWILHTRNEIMKLIIKLARINLPSCNHWGLDVVHDRSSTCHLWDFHGVATAMIST